MKFQTIATLAADVIVIPATRLARAGLLDGAEACDRKPHGCPPRDAPGHASGAWRGLLRCCP